MKDHKKEPVLGVEEKSQKVSQVSSKEGDGGVTANEEKIVNEEELRRALVEALSYQSSMRRLSVAPPNSPRPLSDPISPRPKLNRQVLLPETPNRNDFMRRSSSFAQR